MIGALLKTLLGGLFGNVAAGAAGGVTKVVELGAIAAVITPLALWFHNGGKDETLVAFSLTYGQAALIGLAAWWLVRVLHRAPPPAPPIYNGDYRQ